MGPLHGRTRAGNIDMTGAPRRKRGRGAVDSSPTKRARGPATIPDAINVRSMCAHLHALRDVLYNTKAGAGGQCQKELLNFSIVNCNLAFGQLLQYAASHDPYRLELACCQMGVVECALKFSSDDPVVVQVLKDLDVLRRLCETAEGSTASS